MQASGKKPSQERSLHPGCLLLILPGSPQPGSVTSSSWLSLGCSLCWLPLYKARGFSDQANNASILGITLDEKY